MLTGACICVAVHFFYISLCLKLCFNCFYFLCFLFLFFLFFFSSRRRHTRSLCDWSSDVCSSDLENICCNRAQVAICKDEILDIGHLKLHINNDHKIDINTKNVCAPTKEGLIQYLNTKAVERSEERRVGKECRARGWQGRKQKK